MLPLSDGLPARRFPFVNVAIIVANFAVWLFFRNMYPMTLTGLTACYTAAIPFFRNEPVADLVFSFVFFGTALLLRTWSGTAEEAAKIATR